MAHVDHRGDSALARIEIGSDCVEGGVFHHHDHHGSGEHRRQDRVLEPVREMFGLDEEVEGALASRGSSSWLILKKPWRPTWVSGPMEQLGGPPRAALESRKNPGVEVPQRKCKWLLPTTSSPPRGTYSGTAPASIIIALAGYMLPPP